MTNGEWFIVGMVAGIVLSFCIVFMALNGFPWQKEPAG